MRWRTLLTTAVAGCALLVPATIAQAGEPQTPNTKADVYDCSGNRFNACSFGGPAVVDDGPIVGFVNYRTTNTGDLHIVLSVKKIQPTATLQVDLGCDAWFGAHIRPIGSITTNEAGNGTAQITVPAAQLTAACGPGAHSGHIDAYSFASGLPYVAALGVNFSS